MRALTEAEQAAIIEDRCPECGQTEGFWRGPMALLTSINVYCKCGAGFNILAMRFPHEGQLLCPKGTPDYIQPWFGSSHYQAKDHWDWIRDEMDCHYILGENHIPVRVDLATWAKWLETDRSRRVVRQEDLGPLWVSTVFLGLDHGFGRFNGRKEAPVLFETMVFGTDEKHPFGESYQDRYCTWDESLAGHKKAVDWAKMKLATISGIVADAMQSAKKEET